MHYNELVISPDYGVVTEIYIHQGSPIHEGEVLFSIETPAGELEDVTIGVSGKIHSIEVNEGEDVIPGMVLAYVQGDF